MLLRARCAECGTLQDWEADVEREKSTIPYYGSVIDRCNVCDELNIINYEVKPVITGVERGWGSDVLDMVDMIMKEVFNEDERQDESTT